MASYNEPMALIANFQAQATEIQTALSEMQNKLAEIQAKIAEIHISDANAEAKNHINTAHILEPEAELDAANAEGEIVDNTPASRESTPLSTLSRTPSYSALDELITTADLFPGDPNGPPNTGKHLLESGDDEGPPMKRVRADGLDASQMLATTEGYDGNIGDVEMTENGFVNANTEGGNTYDKSTAFLEAQYGFEYRPAVDDEGAALEVHETIEYRPVPDITASQDTNFGTDGQGAPVLAGDINKVPSSRRPEVWAYKRTALCEALPYYRAYKGSFYTNGGVLYAVLIDGESETRDIFSAQVIITSIGGSRTRDPQTGRMIRLIDTPEKGLYKAILHALENKSPIAMIAGENHPLYPCASPAPYAVLDYFQITHMWKELESSTPGSFVKVWRIRFEKADLTKISWWQEKGLMITDVSAAPRPLAKVCPTCGEESTEVYTSGWTCLNHVCEAYYGTLKATPGFDPLTLAYSNAFVNQRTAFTGHLPALKPAIPNLITAGSNGTDMTARRGIVCSKCGCCISRIFWNRWECSNDACDFVEYGHMLPYPQSELDKEELALDSSLAQKRAKVNEDVANPHIELIAGVMNRQCITIANDFLFGGYNARQYILPDTEGRPIGSFTLFISNEETNANGPDEMFRELEIADIGLKRNPVAVVGHRLEGLSRHFQQNFGARYKFGVEVQSKGFSEAPPAILKALHRLIWASKCAVNATTATLADHPPHEHMPPALGNDFNELLALGFMEKDKISYHDDGEAELGPTVAALALGSPSLMKFRPKKRSGFGLPMTGGRSPQYMDVLEVPMKHGDMMVMHGSRIQGLYEHAVDPQGGRRFSLTSRYIDPDLMASDAERQEAVVSGAISASAAAYTYDGY